MSATASTHNPMETRPDKWIAGLDAAAPAVDAAQRVLKKRLTAVARLSRSVVKAKAEDDEGVHQLRVATRRAEAALLAFKPWVRDGHLKLARKTLKRLRTAAGGVRACDVHRSLLLESLPQADVDSRPAIETALLLWDAQRALALRDLLDVARIARRRIDDAGSRWVRRNDPHSAEVAGVLNLHAAGAAALKELAATFLHFADDDLSVRENLHRLRVQGKRLRYAIEIFGATADDHASLALLSDELTLLQDRLGKVNDLHEVAERLARDAAEAERALIEAAENEHSAISRRLQSLADEFEIGCLDEGRSFMEWWQTESALDFKARIAALAAASTVMAEQVSPEVVVLASNNGVLHRDAETTQASITDDRAADQ